MTTFQVRKHKACLPLCCWCLAFKLLSCLWEPSVQNGVSTKTARSFENRRRKVRKTEARFKEKLGVFVVVVFVVVVVAVVFKGLPGYLYFLSFYQALGVFRTK